MAKDFIPAVRVNDDTNFENDLIDIQYYNTIPLKTGAQEYSIVKRPTFTSAIDLTGDSTVRGRGITDFLGERGITITEDRYYYNDGGSFTDITGGNGFQGDYFAVITKFNQAGSPYLVVQNAGDYSTNASATHGNLWYATDGVSAPTRVTDADMPGNDGVSMIRGAVNLDGYLFVCNIDGKIFNCANDDITTWAATDFITAEREADLGIYLGKHKDHVVYFGTRSIEFFYNAANTSGSPLTGRSDIFYEVKCRHPNAVVEDGEVIYFVGQPQGQRRGVYVLENFGIRKLSNDFIDEKLAGRTFTDPDITSINNLEKTVWLSVIETPRDGKILMLTSGGETWVMEMTTGQWCTWRVGSSPTSTGLGGFSGGLPIVGYSDNYYLFTNAHVAEDNNSGDLDDLGLTAAAAYFYTRPWDLGTNERKKIDCYRILHYPVGTSTESPSNVNIKWMDTDFVSTNGVDPASVTEGDYDIDLTSYTARHYRNGITRQRIHLITLDATKEQVIKGIEVDYTPLRG